MTCMETQPPLLPQQDEQLSSFNANTLSDPWVDISAKCFCIREQSAYFGVRFFSAIEG